MQRPAVRAGDSAIFHLKCGSSPGPACVLESLLLLCRSSNVDTPHQTDPLAWLAPVAHRPPLRGLRASRHRLRCGNPATAGLPLSTQRARAIPSWPDAIRLGPDQSLQQRTE